MLSLPHNLQVYVCTEAVDMRRSFDGLSCAIRQQMNGDPLSGHLFVFVNRRADRCKVLFWDGNGFCLMYKRLEKGTFSLPREDSLRQGYIEIEAAELALMLEGIELKGSKRRPRWNPPRKTDSFLAQSA